MAPWLGAVLLIAGCASGEPARPRASLPTSAVPLTIGPGPRYRPSPLGAAVRAAAPVGGLRCTRTKPRRFGAHVEVFAHRHVVAIPSGIGVGPPQLRVGAYVRGGRCSYPLRTVEPTGVVEIAVGTRASLGDLFDLWGQPLTRRRVGGFAAGAAGVRAFLNGRGWRRDPRAIPLARHAVIVLEVGVYVPPHRSYRFANGL